MRWSNCSELKCFHHVKILMDDACLLLTCVGFVFSFYIEGERRLSDSANIIAVLRANPNAEFVMKEKSDS